MSAYRPPFLFRLAVVVGAACLLLGVVGAGILMARGGAEQADMGALRYVRLTVKGAPPGARLAVEARWLEGEASVRERALPTLEPGVFTLPPLPREKTVLVDVLDERAEPPRILHTAEVPPDVSLDLEVAIP
jgi:hypothetical protein